MPTLKISQIKTNGGTQSRKKINNKKVIDYAELMKEGVVFKPVVVFFDGKTYWLADGFHRVSAYKSNGVLEIEVEVKEGSQRDAFIYAIGANNDGRGLSMTPQENRDNIIILIQDKEWGKWSDEHIAKIVGVSRVTVYRIRKKLEKEGEVDPKAKTTYVNKHGQKAEMNISKEEGKGEVKEEAKKEPEISADEAEVIQMSDTINHLSEENEKLREKVALGRFDGNEFEKMDIQEMLEDLRKKNNALEAENKTLRESRDAYQYENAELMKTVKSLKAKLKKAGIE
jgi:ParB-like chromosome segregation protein Spo0J